ncbi:precorrin-8X methylmutase [Breznakibacter xylanolyticus]|uniref:Precorrin-8X methylmutase n=1 Tax=Breznakibacter xylanolyticus TaxID=990 RepID=A0A2W7NQN7_9BACT|nr:precorrin-3B C(17)-methyltransferase [Breznakibacter xylanolyticus]PZX20387.1 precorrin-8X methylmutase [Breznakibacter xylanolyticus]
MKIFIIGIGPGHAQYLTPQASATIAQSDVIVGYSMYLDLIAPLIVGKATFGTGMKKETQRAREAFDLAEGGQTVAVISSGDAGVYGMASLMWEMKAQTASPVELETVPGLSSMFAAAALMGAPLGHDFCAISLSDLLTPWETIERRIVAAAQGDFVTAVYNPVSHDRYWQLMRLRELFLQCRSPHTPVGIARQVGRDEQSVRVITLGELSAADADMLSIIIIGNSQSFAFDDKLVTPRGYADKYGPARGATGEPGRQIMRESFGHILDQLGNTDHLPLENLWVALHCIHTTADFSMAELVEMAPGTVDAIHRLLYSGQPPVIVTDVKMVTEGIRKAKLQELGIEVKCYINDPEVVQLASDKHMTRAQAAMQVAVREHPNAIYAFGNAPTALMELVRLTRLGKAAPAAVVAAPVGFVNVEESKHRVKFGLDGVPAVIVRGRKGGSNVAATILNAILSWSDALAVNPGAGIHS